jgi:signal transduction histidine kinase
LFEPGLSGKAHGNGIGLSISNQLCRHMGGELRLVDTGPGGSEFEIRVPLATGE